MSIDKQDSTVSLGKNNNQFYKDEVKNIPLGRKRNYQ